jgi:hypothetical protein
MIELPALEAALDAAARRRYGRARWRRLVPRARPAIALAAAAAVIAAIVLLWPAATPRPRPAEPRDWTTTTNAARGFSVSLPAGWALARERLTPKLVDPRELFSAGTFPLHYRPGGCNHMPDAALRSMGPRDGFVSVLESSPSDTFPPRPRHFRAQPTTGLECIQNRFETSWLLFADRGRDFYALVVLGRQAPASVRGQAFEILDRLRVERRSG